MMAESEREGSTREYSSERPEVTSRNSTESSSGTDLSLDLGRRVSSEGEARDRTELSTDGGGGSDDFCPPRGEDRIHRDGRVSVLDVAAAAARSSGVDRRMAAAATVLGWGPVSDEWKAVGGGGGRFEDYGGGGEKSATERHAAGRYLSDRELLEARIKSPRQQSKDEALRRKEASKRSNSDDISRRGSRDDIARRGGNDAARRSGNTSRRGSDANLSKRGSRESVSDAATPARNNMSEEVAEDGEEIDLLGEDVSRLVVGGETPAPSKSTSGEDESSSQTAAAKSR